MVKEFIREVIVMYGENEVKKTFYTKNVTLHEFDGTIKLYEEKDDTSKTILSFSKSLPHIIEYY